MPPLSLAVAQPSCVALDVVANVAAHAAVVRAANARVVAFPEMSVTGYELQASALTTDDPRWQPLVRACADTGTLALVGAPLAEDGAAFIAVLAVDGAGVRVAYRKMNVHGDESMRFGSGTAPAMIEVDGRRLGLAICRDTGIAAHAAATAALGIDIYVAGTVMAPDERAIQDERARRIAITHDVVVAIAGFAGPTGGGYPATSGGSGVWDRDGSVVVQAGDAAGEWVRAEIDRPTGITPAAARPAR